ncbi:MAG: hypothetical protein GQE15_12515 [Archangiaceae bacterium]|nr:hypothetical protein [Archangiaceae bacterium]
MTILAMVVALSLTAAEKPKLAVLDLQVSGAAPEEGTALTDAITQQVSKREFFQVIASADIRTLLGMERQRQLLGCAEDSTSCTAELAGALGARFVLSGTLSKLGDAYQLSLQTLDTQKSQPVGRSIRIASDVKELAEQLPWATAEATGTPVPQPPSRVLPITLISVGAAALIAGSIVGFSTLLEENGINRDLSKDPATGSFLRLEQYQRDAERLGLQRTISIASLITGAALVGTGVFFAIRPVGGSTALIVPTSNGFAFAGVFP